VEKKNSELHGRDLLLMLSEHLLEETDEVTKTSNPTADNDIKIQS
jgi:hypothetical protein